jgi:uncharacterized protein YjiS (DUF1127 family)
MYRTSTITQLPLPQRLAEWLRTQFSSARSAAVVRQTARDIGKLSPHQLRDIGLPESLSELTRRSLRDWIREEIL